MYTKILLSIIIAFLLFFGAFAVGYFSNVNASTPKGVWLCLAVSEGAQSSEYYCEATGRSVSKKAAEKSALKACKSECAKHLTCRIQGCVRGR